MLRLYVSDSPDYTVTNTISNSRTRLGETITLSCNIAGGTAKVVRWWHELHFIKKVSFDMVTSGCSAVLKGYESRLTKIQCDKNNYNFQLSNVQRSDRGLWLCEADGQVATNSPKLDVLVPPDVEVKISKTTVNEHESVRFECATSGGYPEHIERHQWLWMKSGSTVEQVIQDSETSTQNGKLFEFVRIPYDMSGTYSCKAWNLGGMGQAWVVLTVHFSPRIDQEANMTYDVVGEMGKEASFELFIIANPTPATTGYTWSKDDNILSNSSSEYEIISGPTSSKLAIEHVKSSDYGNYTCSVKTSGFQAKVFKFKLFKPGLIFAIHSVTGVLQPRLASRDFAFRISRFIISLVSGKKQGCACWYSFEEATIQVLISRGIL
ncbi:hemicentin-1-like [Lineus longissimus]|uniref:hemicentin-1-like n=1 Tax=Lineus longissimus TaxID=88925 RepID=UPI00315C76F9